MRVTREVINDLMPVYLSGEASPDTRTLVESFLGEDPELAALARVDVDGALRGGAPAAPAEDLEMRTLRRVKRMLTARSVLIGIAVFLTVLPLSFTFGPAGVHWVWQAEPGGALAVAAAALATWMAVIALGRRLRGGA